MLASTLSEDAIVEGSSVGLNPPMKQELARTYTSRTPSVNFKRPKFCESFAGKPGSRSFYDVCAEFDYRGPIGRVTPDVLPVLLPGVFEANDTDGTRTWSNARGRPSYKDLNHARARPRVNTQHQTASSYGAEGRHKHVTHHQQHTAEHAFDEDVAYEPTGAKAMPLSSKHGHSSYHSRVADHSYGDSIALRQASHVNHHHGVTSSA